MHTQPTPIPDTRVRHAAPARPASARGFAAALLAAAVATGCASAPDGPAPVGPRPPTPELPAIPEVDGPLELNVEYPRDSAYVATRGDNFIFGSAGTGRARVWIDDEEVEVRPNGAFLAFLPVPADSVYHLRATRGDRTVRLEVPISLPPAPPAPADTPQILPGSVTPTGAWAALPGERIEVGFRGTRGGEAWLALPGGARVPLVESRSEEGGASDFVVSSGAGGGDVDSPWSSYRGFFTARRILAADTTVAWPRLAGGPRPSRGPDGRFATRERVAGVAPEPADRSGAIGVSALPDRIRRATEGAPENAGAAVVLAVGGDTVVRSLPLNLVLADPDRPRVGIGRDPDEPAENGDGHIIARPGPGGGPYHYTWPNGVELELTGERNGIYRVRLTDDLSAWTPAGDVRLAEPGAPPPVSRVAGVRLDPRAGYIDVQVALDRPLPYAIEEDDSVLSLLVYGATSRVNFLQHGRVDPYIARGEWSQPSDRLFRLDLHLAQRAWGYETFWGEGDDLVLRLKRPPAIDPDHPLAELTIGVDAGHGGADRRTWGPTGLAEADANLGVAMALRDLLEERGARVVMTRTADSTLSLVQRTELARAEDVDLWISVHNNAFPDGVNPWENNGTSVYYNHPRAAALAWSVQRALLDELGLRDLGVGRADLHQARFTWAPAILTETMFMMIPEQEAFLRSAEGQRRIAEAHLRGIVAWLRGL